MQLGRPGAAALGLAVHAHELGQVSRAHALGREAIEHVGERAGHGHRAVDRDIGAGQQVAHDEGQEVRARRGPEGEPDRTTPVGLLVAGQVGRVADHPPQALAVPVVGLEARRRDAVGIGGLLVERPADPGAELGQAPFLIFQEPGRPAPEQALQVNVELEEVEAARRRRVVDRLRARDRRMHGHALSPWLMGIFDPWYTTRRARHSNQDCSPLAEAVPQSGAAWTAPGETGLIAAVGSHSRCAAGPLPRAPLGGQGVAP